MIEPIDQDLIPKRANGDDEKREFDAISAISGSTNSIPVNNFHVEAMKISFFRIQFRLSLVLVHHVFLKTLQNQRYE
jgi:hypothetical protein